MSTPSTITPPTSSSTESPFFFPPELLKEIFSHCDASTLAAVSRVSFACLELSSKMLYEDIVLRDAQSTAKLLRLSTSAPTRTPAKTSERVSTHTSLSLIHSFTFRGDRNVDVSPLKRYKSSGPPLSIPVLAISVSAVVCEPDRDEDTDSIIGISDRVPVDARFVLHLFNPRTLILRGRRPALSAPFPDHVRLFELIGGDLYEHQTYSTDGCFRDCVTALAGDRPLRIIWDFLDVQGDAELTLRRTIAAYGLDNAIHTNEGLQSMDGLELRAWFHTGDIKNGLASSQPARGHIGHEVGKSVVFEVPSARVRRLRDEIVLHGVHKNLDWAALDAL